MPNKLEAVVIDVIRPFVDNGVELTPRTSLLDGNLDSMAMVQIILALEQRVGVRFGPSDLQFDHFESVETLATQLETVTSSRQ